MASRGFGGLSHMKKFLLVVFCHILWGPVQAADPSVSFLVKHDHLFGSGQGRLTISSTGVSYHSEKDEKHFQNWDYTDIQEISIKSPTRLQIRTYEDVRWKLGQDRRFNFEIIDGVVTPETVQFLRKKLPGLVVSAVFSEPADAFYKIPVKHQHSLGGGCDGELLFGPKEIYYISSNREHSRAWPLETIEGLGRRSNFSLRITVREQNLLRKERSFEFQLKRPIDGQAYELLWRQVYEPDSWLTQHKRERIELEGQEF